LAAPPGVRTHVRALRAITLPHRLLHRGRHTARSRLRALVASPGLLRRPELFLLELLDERVQRQVQHLGHIPRSDLTPKERPSVAELRFCALVDRELEPSALGGERYDPSSGNRRCHPNSVWTE